MRQSFVYYFCGKSTTLNPNLKKSMPFIARIRFYYTKVLSELSIENNLSTG